MEIQLRAEDPRFHRTVDTIYFGGGTPSLLHPSEITRILDLVRGRFAIDPNAEITLETNPGTVNREKLHALHSAGINRMSVGVQSFSDDDLRFLSRIHTSSEATKCLKDVRAAGFDNVSIDLIFSLPDQSVQRWKSNLERAIAFQPEHISCYSLIVEPETPLFRMVQTDRVPLPNAEQDADLYECAIEFLSSHGYEQYEVSNFARRNPERSKYCTCRHNLNYWNHSNYLGFGPSAHSFWEKERWWNISDLSQYIECLHTQSFPLSGGEHLAEPQLMEEAIFLGLRSDGIDLDQFRRRFNQDLLTKYTSVFNVILNEGHATIEGGRIKLTAKGYVVCDEICQSFY